MSGKKLYEVEFLDKDNRVVAHTQQTAEYPDQARLLAMFRLEDLAGMEVDEAVNANNRYADIRVVPLQRATQE